MLHYQEEPELDAEELIDLLNRSGLAERRPVADKERIGRMIAGATLLVTCRNNAGRLIGVARTITDYSYCAYLSDLAVDEVYQGQGIGRELMVRSKMAAGEEATLILLAAPTAESYYEHLGLERHNACFIIPRTR